MDMDIELGDIRDRDRDRDNLLLILLLWLNPNRSAEFEFQGIWEDYLKFNGEGDEFRVTCMDSLFLVSPPHLIGQKHTFMSKFLNSLFESLPFTYSALPLPYCMPLLIFS